MSKNPQILLDKLQEIKVLYAEVKEAIILGENFDTEHDFYLTSFNELRNALDHVMRSLEYNDSFENELNEAKEHIYRAGYDTYEILSINIGEMIVNCIEEYDSEIISTIFPSYYTQIKPSLIDIQIELADVRSHKRVDATTGIKSFNPYKEKVLLLIGHLKICQKAIPDLRIEKSKKIKRKIRNAIISGAGAIILTVIASMVYDNFFKERDSPTITKDPNGK